MSTKYTNEYPVGGGERVCRIVLLSLVAVLFACSVLLMKGCIGGSRNDGDSDNVRYKYIYVRDTVRKTVLVKDIVPKVEIVPATDTIVVRDTVTLIRDYFTERQYEYGYCDSDFRFTSDIIVRENEIKTVRTDYELFHTKTIVEKTVTRQPVFRFGMGVGVASHFNREWDIELNTAAGIKRHTLTVGYGIRDNRLCVGYRYDIISR